MKRPPHPFCDLWRYVPLGFESRGVERAARFVGTALVHYGWHACFLLRLSQWCRWLRLGPVAFVLHRLLLHLYGIDIPPSTQVGAGFWMPHALNIVIHHNSVVGRQVTVFQNVTLGGRENSGYPVVADGACLYVGCSVLGAVRVGEGAAIGAHAVVMTDVPDGYTAVGVPARAMPPQDGQA